MERHRPPITATPIAPSPRRPRHVGLLAATIAIEAIILALATGNAIRLTEERMLRQAGETAARVAAVMAATLAEPLGRGDIAVARSTLDPMRQAGGALHLVLLDPENQMLATSGSPIPPERTVPLPERVQDIVWSGQVVGRLRLETDPAPIEQAKREVLEEGLAIAAIGIGATLLALGPLLLGLIRRADEITVATRALVAGERNAPPLPEGDDALGRLAAAINRLARKITEREIADTRRLAEIEQTVDRHSADLEAKATLLEDSERLLRLAQTFANVGAWEFNPQTRAVRHSDRLPALFGIDGPDTVITYDRFIDILHPDDRERVIESLGRSAQLGTPYEIEHRIVLADGTVRWLYERGAVVLDGGGRPIRLLGITQDIDRRRRAEDALRVSEERFRELFQSAPVAYQSLDSEGRYLAANDELCALLGRDGDNILGRSFGELWSPATRCRFTETFRHLVEAGQIRGELELERPDGSLIHVLLDGRVQRAPDGSMVRTHCVLYDIDARRKAEQRLRTLSMAVEQSPTPVLITDTTGAIEYANPSLLDTYGYTIDDLIGQTPRVFKSDDKPPEFYRALWDTILAGDIWRGEFHNRRKDGSLVWVLATIGPVKDTNGHITHFLGLSEDITARKMAEQEADENRRRLDEAQRLAGLGSWEYDMSNDRLTWSDTTFAIFGRDPATFIPTLDAFVATIHPDDRDLFDASHREIEHSGQKELPLRILRPDGEIRHVLSRARLTGDPQAPPTRMVGTVLDVTAQEKASANRDLFRRIIDDADQAVRIADTEGRILFVNKAFLRLTGFPRDQVEGRIYTEFMADPTSDAAGQIARAYAEGRSWSGRLDIRRADGGHFTSLSNAGTVLDNHGRAQYLFSIFSDFTSEIERQRELGEARDAALQASQAKSAFLANMSHELRTPMNAILGFSQFLEMDKGLTDGQRDSVATIYKAGTHLLDLINEILDLARIEAGHIDLAIEAVVIRPVLDECLDLIAPLAQERGLSVHRVALPPGLTARVDRIRLKQVLVNLLSNAVKYNRPNGSIRVEAERRGPDTLRLTVADTGQGISPDRLTELFVPFNRLGAEYTEVEGTGIGLALTRRIVDAMNGTVGVESDPGRGCRFWIDLPAIPADPTHAATAIAESPPPVSEVQTSVLYIDDDPVNLKLLEQVFVTQTRLRLITAPTPGLGLDLARLRLPGLILLDINLPGLDGWDVLARLRTDPRTRDIPVMAVTARAMPGDIERGRSAGFDAYLTKPIDIPHLLDTVRSLIRRPDPDGTKTMADDA